MKPLLLSGLLVSSLSFAAQPIVNHSGSCPATYMKISGVCVNPELICDSQSNLRAAIKSYRNTGQVSEEYNCGDGGSYSSSNYSTQTFEEYVPAKTYTSPAVTTVDYGTTTCQQMRATLTQYQTEGVPMHDSHTQSESMMDDYAAQQVINRIQAKISSQCGY